MVAEQVAGTSLAAFWDTAVAGTAELDYAEALGRSACVSAPAAPADRRAPGSGVTTRNDAGRLLVSQVRRDTPASRGPERGRRDPGDWRLPRARGSAGQPPRAVPPGDRVTLLVARREQLMRTGPDLRRRAAARLAAGGPPLGAGGPAEHAAEVAVGRQGMSQPPASDATVRSYGRVMLVWVLVLAGLYVFQEYFS